MKKINLIRLSACALLLASPVIVESTLSVKAATTLNSTNINATNYFTYNGKKLANNAYICPGNGVTISKDNVTSASILAQAKKLVEFHSSDGHTITTTAKDIAIQLSDQGINISDLNNSNIPINLPKVGFNIRLSDQTYNGVYVTIHFNPLATSSYLQAPIISVDYQQNGQNIEDKLENQVFQVAPNSKFDPTSFIGTNGTRYTFVTNDKKVSVSYLSSTVNTANPGSFGTVILKAVGSDGSEAQVAYQVLVKPEGQVRLNVNPKTWTNTYTIYNGKLGSNSSTISDGTKIYVGNDTMIIDGISYTRFSQKSQSDANKSSNNNWIKTSDLANINSSPKTITKTVMHKALVYNSEGNSKKRTIKAYKKVELRENPVVINGQKYYAFANSSTDFIKASNITGIKRTLKRNAYVYETSMRRAKVATLKKGTKVTTYGGSYKFKNGKKYYRIAGATPTKKRYVKVANFK